MMFKLKHKLPVMVGMAASLVFGAENAAAEIDARFADEASFRTYFSGLTTQYDKDWALAAAVVYCKPELAKIALDGGASINTTAEQVGYKYFGFDKGRWLFINGEETLAPVSYVDRGIVVTVNERGEETVREDLKDYYTYLEDYKEKLARYELSYDGNSRNPKWWMLPDKGVSYGGETLLAMAAGTCKNVGRDGKAMTKLLLDYGADASADGAAARALRNAFLQGDLPVVEFWLNEGVKLPFGHQTVQTLLSTTDNEKMFKMLIDMGGDVNAYDEDGRTPLMRAVNFSSDIVRNLLQYGADVNAKDKRDGKPAWQQIAVVSTSSNPEAETLRLLLAAGVDATLKSNSGYDIFAMIESYKQRAESAEGDDKADKQECARLLQEYAEGWESKYKVVAEARAAAQQDKYRRYKKPVVQNALPKTARKLKSPRELPSVKEMYELHEKAEHGGRKAETSFFAPGAEQPSAGKGTAASTADGNNAAAESAGGGREMPAEEVEEQILLF